ncbi:MAG: hypothetical protein GY874_14325 [Desulfobacteraceae bacterium]|nr:hypothetical protein [Desulfobacteraceae bacterium]
MITIKTDIHGKKAAIFLQTAQEAAVAGAKTGLNNIGRTLHRAAYEFLSGPKKDTGGYPVPVRKGHLRRSLDWLFSGQEKAKDLEAVVFNSAAYAKTIHDGQRSSEKFGARPFLQEPLEKLVDDGELESIINNAIDDAIKRSCKTD